MECLFQTIYKTVETESGGVKEESWKSNTNFGGRD